MGMLAHCGYAAVVMKDGTCFETYWDLPNEQEVMLSEVSDLFRDVSSIEQVVEGLQKAFVDSESFDDRFEGLLERVQEQSLENISAVILITDKDAISEHCYTWRLYHFHPYVVESGEKIAVRKPRKREFEPSLPLFIITDLMPKIACELPLEEDEESEELTAEQATAELEEFKKTFGFSIRKKDEMSLGTFHPKGIVIKRYKGKEKTVVIPEYVGGHKVSEIEYFGSNRFVEQVELPLDVRIDDGAFDDCKKLHREDSEGNVTVLGRLIKVGTVKPVMELPAGITSIARRLVESNKELRELVIPEGVKEIGSSAFGRCWGLKKLVLPSTLELIESYAFRGCSGLEEVCFPEGLKEIGNYAFADCYKLLPKGVGAHVKCGKGAFAGCSPSLAREDGITCFGGTMYDLHLKKHKEYLGLPDEEWSVVIPADIKCIAGSIIFNNPGNTLDSLTIHNGLEYMSSGDFFLQGIRKLRLVDRESGALLMETEAFASCDTVLASTTTFKMFCEKIEKGDYSGLIKKYDGKKAKKK